MSVALSAAVTKVSVTLHTGHMVTSLCTLNMNLMIETGKERLLERQSSQPASRDETQRHLAAV